MDCNFCGKAQWEVMFIIAGPNVYICDECIEMCNKIIFEQARKKDRELNRIKLSLATRDRKWHRQFFHMWS